jgi:hypothetical protein
MTTGQKSKCLAFGIPGLILQIGCLTSNHILVTKASEYREWIMLLSVGSLVGVLLLILSLRHFAKSKGYGPEWGLLGIFSILGILIVFALPDKTKQ